MDNFLILQTSVAASKFPPFFSIFIVLPRLRPRLHHNTRRCSVTRTLRTTCLWNKTSVCPLQSPRNRRPTSSQLQSNEMYPLPNSSSFLHINLPLMPNTFNINCNSLREGMPSFLHLKKFFFNSAVSWQTCFQRLRKWSAVVGGLCRFQRSWMLPWSGTDNQAHHIGPQIQASGHSFWKGGLPRASQFLFQMVFGLSSYSRVFVENSQRWPHSSRSLRSPSLVPSPTVIKSPDDLCWFKRRWLSLRPYWRRWQSYTFFWHFY